MEKIKISKNQQKNVIFEFNGDKIEVIPYIDKQTQEGLIKVYFSAFFEGDKENRLNAEVINKMAILDLMTNIDIDVEAGKDVGSGKLVNLIDDVTASGLWEKITKSIKNYREYEYTLSCAIDQKRKETGDVAYIVNRFLENNVLPILEKFKNIDLDASGFGELKTALSEFAVSLKGSPMESIIKSKTL